MDNIILLTKFLILSLVGYYVLNISFKDNCIYKGMISPFYGFFGIFIQLFCDFRIPVIFFLGMALAWLINFLFGLIDQNLKTSVNVKWFGFFALFQVFFINSIIDAFLSFSNYQSIMFLFVFMGVLFIIDVVFTFRNLV